MLQGLYILAMAFMQNISFTSVSRARNRNNMRYHIVAGIFSNSIWFFTMKALVAADMTALLFLPYTLGTVTGSLTGAKISMRIERWLHATSDDHIRKQPLFVMIADQASAIHSNGTSAFTLDTAQPHIHGPFMDQAAVTEFQRAHADGQAQKFCFVFSGQMLPLHQVR